jgi:hypothetical protein
METTNGKSIVAIKKKDFRMPTISIAGLTLDEQTYAPTVNISFEYFKTNSGVIIGGHIIASIKGVVSISDNGSGTSSGSLVMQRLKNVRDLGKVTQCIQVNIPNFDPLNNKAKITSVSIDQGPDPTWVNQGAYSIELKGLVSNLPGGNPYNITAADGVTQLSRTESIEIGENSHGYIYNSQGVSKAYVKFNNSVTLKCEPYCSNVNPIDVLKKIVQIGPQNQIFNQYRSWTSYLQSRNLEINTDGTITFSSGIILTPYAVSALVDLNFAESQTYENKDKTYTTSGTITGLVPVSFSDLVTVGSSCSQSKLTAAFSTFNIIKNLYSDFGSWGGSTLTLVPKDCDIDVDNPFAPLCGDAYEDDEDPNEDTDEIKPSTVNVTTSRTDGTINFSFEWSTTQNDGGKCVTNGIRRETTVEITERQPNFVEHYIPSYGTLLQNMNCNSAKRISVTNSVTYPQESCGQNIECEANEGQTIDVSKYFGEGRWLIIGHSITQTTNSYTDKRDYIECRV